MSPSSVRLRRRVLVSSPINNNNNNNLFTYSAHVPWKDAHKRITHYKNELITKFTILAYKMVQQTMHN